MAKIKLDDLDKGFGLGTIFGIGVATIVTSIVKACDTARRIKSSRLAMERLCREVDENIRKREEAEGY